MLLQEALSRKFPPILVDRLAVLLANRSADVIPGLAAYIQRQLSLPATDGDGRMIQLAAYLLAYAGDDNALRAIETLIGLDPVRFTPFVQMTLNNAQNWGNPFDLAYRAMETGTAAVRLEVRKWVRARATSRMSQQFWAASMKERYPNGLTAAVLENDPLLDLLEPGTKMELMGRLQDEAAHLRERDKQ
ncbi:hypothetical protein [uncultured Paludibaculum sp.]|uniref:hypothetical protein n=1 Tax=uncultured Paludibaculum sp. TaxID=1765020 RepID=UPI002AABB06F|nr:hypothetical protein [uncultured Paludibaculum sp.]